MTATLTTPHTMTPEELVRRARTKELRESIARLVTLRRMIKGAYSLPHQSEEHLKAMAGCRTTMGVKCCSWQEHAVPNRHDYRADLTDLHVELATLRGKQHIVPKKT